VPGTSTVLICCCSGEGFVALLGLNVWIDAGGGGDMCGWLSVIEGSMQAFT
jgi:hypothetical protein